MSNQLLMFTLLIFSSFAQAGIKPGDRILGSGSDRGSECSFTIDRVQRNSIQLSGVILGSRLQSAQFTSYTTRVKFGKNLTLYQGPVTTSTDGKLTTSYSVEMDQNQNIQRIDRDLWKGRFGSQRISNTACTSFRKD